MGEYSLQKERKMWPAIDSRFITAKSKGEPVQFGDRTKHSQIMETSKKR
jgi:hypothetical protein